MTQRASIALGRYDWPGNVRELENAIGHACMMVLSDTIDVADLPESVRVPGYREAAAAQPEPASGIAAVEESKSAASLLENTERRLIADALAKTSGNQSEAARLLRIGRDALRYKMKKYGLG
jgi:DNA-binding NtrC family response regulator